MAATSRTAPSLPGPFWLIGCGNMAGAMLHGWLDAGIDASKITVIDPGAAPIPGVRLLASAPAGEMPALVLLGVKPQILDDVAATLAPALRPDTILISILAGTELSSLRARFPDCGTIVRAMPNTPARLRKAAIGLCSNAISEPDQAFVTELAASIGIVEWFDERLFDVVTALSGSGPAFVFRFIDALGAAAAELGLPPDQAARLAMATVEGASLLAAGANESPGRLADRVASPGGSTRYGLDVLDQDGRLFALVSDTLEAAVRRNREMAEAAR